MGVSNSRSVDEKHKKHWRYSMPDYFNLIPVELSFELLSYFGYASLCRIASVNKLMYQLATEEKLWKTLYHQDFKQKRMDFFTDRKKESWRALYKETLWLERRLNRGGITHHKTIKLVVTGDNCNGQKTALLLAYYHNACPDVVYKGYVPAVFDNQVVDLTAVSANEIHSIQLGLWDTSGHEEFERLRPLSYANTNVFLLCFSIVDPPTFESISTRWFPEIKMCCPDVPLILVGLEKELRFDVRTLKKLKARNLSKPITTEQGIELAQQLGVPYFEVSAATGFGLKAAFRAAVKSVLSPNSAINTKTKMGLRPLKTTGRRENAFLMSSGNSGPFKGKEIAEYDEYAQSKWQPHYTEDGDQYWYNSTTNQSINYETFEDSQTKPRPREVVVSSPFNLKHTSFDRMSEFQHLTDRDSSGFYISESPSNKAEKERSRVKKSPSSDVFISAPRDFRHVSGISSTSEGIGISSHLDANLSTSQPMRTTWKNYQAAKEPTPKPPQPSSPPQRPEWQEFMTEDGFKYWWNTRTLVSTWDNPFKENDASRQGEVKGRSRSNSLRLKERKSDVETAKPRIKESGEVREKEKKHKREKRPKDGIEPQRDSKSASLRISKQVSEAEDQSKAKSHRRQHSESAAKTSVTLSPTVAPVTQTASASRSGTLKSRVILPPEAPPVNPVTLSISTPFNCKRWSMPVELANALAESMKTMEKEETKQTAKPQSLSASQPTSPLQVKEIQNVMKAERRSRRRSVGIADGYSTVSEYELAHPKSTKEKSKPKARSSKEPKESDEEDDGSVKFAVLIRKGDDEFPFKCKVRAKTVNQLVEKLQRKFDFSRNATLVFHDKEFDEYVRLPTHIEDLPTKLKLLVIDGDQEEDEEDDDSY
eukprot:TRINITY_DN3211_c0_g1_i1.p1 TRINITY_DN3211_c0_g1~~TRINITY_DN3211_c0_g1_i1.p1  ORF type:complete len:885 (+),score=252.80 TRINITY_DN3211_c0_g1_i1:27-2657(+)